MPVLPHGLTFARACLPLAATAVAAAALSVVPLGEASAATAPALSSHAAAPSQAWPGHRDRALVRYVVRRGDTATSLAVRYHAWTAELIALNRLGRRGALHLGRTIRIPVVLSAARAAGQKVGHTAKKHGRKRAPLLIRATTPPRGWRGTDLSRTQVRDLVARMARHYRVPPRLALAVAWQESGWQQRRVSSTGAIGVMQVMPGTGVWMRSYAGRQLRLRDVHDNVQAGVLTLRTLRTWTKRDVTAVAAYYQGLRSVRHVGWFDDTRAYVRAVLAHERRLAHGLSPR
jgi:soluble lytic murein transglycosylase-like protein